MTETKPAPSLGAKPLPDVWPDTSEKDNSPTYIKRQNTPAWLRRFDTWLEAREFLLGTYGIWEVSRDCDEHSFLLVCYNDTIYSSEIEREEVTETDLFGERQVVRTKVNYTVHEVTQHRVPNVRVS